MKNLFLVFTALLVISGIVSVNLWRDLRTERLANAELQSQLADAGNVPPAPPVPEPPAQTVATPPPAAVPDPPVAAAKRAQLPVESEVLMRATAAAVSASASATAMVATGGISDMELMKDPEYRKAQLTQARLRLAQSNPGLAEALGLSRKEADHLFQVMAESQLNLTAEFTEMVVKAGGTTPSMAAMMRSAAGREDPAHAVLGEARYAQYQEYQRNAKPVLARVATMGNTLNYAGQPLNDSQARALAAAISTEQQRQRQQAAAAPSPIPVVQRNMADSLAESQKTRDENDRRILEAATPHLNAGQIDALQKQIEQQAAQSRRTIETARGLDARRQAPPQPASSPTRAP
jgi:hypothetical protein